MKRLVPILVLLCSPCVRAELKTVSFEAEITTFEGPLAGLKTGDTVTGKYTYDTKAKDERQTEPNFSSYYFTTPPCSMLINLNGKAIRTSFGKSLGITIVNDMPDGDILSVGGIENIYDGNDFIPESVGCIFWDTTAKALDSKKLPDKAPVLKRFNSRNYLCVIGKSGDLTPYFYADVRKIADGDKLFVPLVEILPASGDFTMGQSIIPVIRIEAAETTGIKIEKILLDDVDVTERYLTASHQGKLLGDQPGVVWQLLAPKPSPGMHVFKVKARLADGRKIWGQAAWNILHAKMEKTDRPGGRTESQPKSASAARR